MSRRAWALLATATLLAGCSIGTDDSPRDIPPGDRVELRRSADDSAGAATGTARIYLLSPQVVGQRRTVQPVARDVPETPADVLAALLRGPNAQEFDAQVRTALPEGTTLRGTRLQGNVLLVDLSGELQELAGEVLVDAVGQIVLTATELPGIDGVRIALEGTVQQWPAGNGELQSDPLTRFDYPGLVLSSQPDFPAIPSPSQ
jgi:spore germination protein GerM